MKKFLCIMGMLLCLSGCGAEETFETVADGDAVQTMLAEPLEISITLPEEAVLPVMETDTGRLYICKDFEVSTQTLNGGDLQGTVHALTGYLPEELSMVQTQKGELDCYEFVWAAAAEGGDQVGRGLVMDDGHYHYCVCAMIDAEDVSAYAEIWNGMFETVRLI